MDLVRVTPSRRPGRTVHSPVGTGGVVGGTNIVRPRWGLVTAGVAGVLLAGCASPDITLESRPTDAAGAQDLAELVARTAECGSLEYYDDTGDTWDFTCQSGQASYLIRVVRDDSARRAGLQDLGSSPPVKGGAYFLVQAGTRPDGKASGDLGPFPGDVEG